MKNILQEEAVLLVSAFKWTILATFVGGVVGLSTAIFLKILNLGIAIAASYSYYFLFLPLAMFSSALLVKYLAPDAEGHGTEKVIEAVNKYSGKIKPLVVPVKLFATVITIALGGSAGKEGPCAQIGGGLSSIFADILGFDNKDRKKLVICGISAGFASVFGTPLAGAIFGVEVLYTGSILYEVLLPSVIAGIVSYHVTSAFGITYFYHPLKFVPVFSESIFIEVILAGIFFGLCSLLLIEGMKLFKKLSEKITIWAPLKGIAGGFILVILTLLFSKQYLGLGLNAIQTSLEKGEGIIWYAFILKIIFTSVTLNFGGSGGIATPIFFIGSTAGVLFAKLLGLKSSTFAAIGLVAVLAGAANTPISASIMSAELFGVGITPYASVACVISFLMTGYRSVYPSQILAIKKSASIDVEVGKEVEEIHPRIVTRDRSLIGISRKIVKKIEKQFSRKRNNPTS